MEIEDIITKVNQIFNDVLDNEEIILTKETTANDIDEWDSLTNIQLVVAIEKYFRIRFSSNEIQSFKNIGELSLSISKKLTL